jgi:hypothetical protein
MSIKIAERKETVLRKRLDGRPFSAVMSAKKDRPWRRRRRKSCDFQGYHHRRQKELRAT